MLVDDATHCSIRSARTRYAHGSKDALGDHDVTVVFAVETSKHIRIPEHCGTRIVFPTGERTVDLMDGIPAGLLSQCGPDDIMTRAAPCCCARGTPVDTVRHGQNLKFFTLESETS